MTQRNEVTCLRCGWVSWAITKAQAEKYVADYNAWFNALPAEMQARDGRQKGLDSYNCMRCGGSEFRKSVDDDCPAGVTISPVVADEFAAKGE